MKNTAEISVIIPVYNDPDGLDDTLNALVSQSCPSEKYEIIVVDNDSDDHTPEVAASYANEHTNVTRLIEDQVQSSYAARNTGIEHSNGDILAFLDADVIVERDWLSSAVTALQERELDYMGCNVQVVVPDSSKTLAAKYNQRNDFPVERFIEEDHFAPTVCLFVRKKVIDNIGKFDSKLISGGDMEFGNRVHDSGYNLGYEPSITVYHPARFSFRAILKKSFRVGVGSAQLGYQYPERYGQLSVINPIILAARLTRQLYRNIQKNRLLKSNQSTPQNEGDQLTRIQRVLFLFIGIATKTSYILGRIQGIFAYQRSVEK